MLKFNFLKITAYAVFVFVCCIIFYNFFAWYTFNKYDDVSKITSYLLENYEMIFKAEGYVKQTVLSIVILFYGLGVAQNTLKLSNINELAKKVYFSFTLVVVSLLSIVSIILIFTSSLVLYQLTSLLMLLITLIWITTIMIDFVKTKNNYQSIFIRVALAVLGVILVSSVSTKVVNDYKVNVSLNNYYEFKIEQLEQQLPYLDDASIVVIQKTIDSYKEMQIPLYTTGLYSGKSVFFMYNTLSVDLFGEDRLIQLDNAVNVLNDLIDNYNPEEGVIDFEIYDINAGLYVGGSTIKILMVIILLLGAVCSIKYPLLREENDVEEDTELEITKQMVKELMTKEELKALIKKVE